MRLAAVLTAVADQQSVNAAAASTLLSAEDKTRLGLSIYNDSAADLYVLFGPAGSVASTSNFSVKVLSGGYYEVPTGYVGPVYGIWSSAVGAARLTRFV